MKLVRLYCFIAVQSAQVTQPMLFKWPRQLGQLDSTKEIQSECLYLESHLLHILADTKSGPTKISTAPPTLTPIPAGKTSGGGVPTSTSLPSSSSGGGVSSASSGGVVKRRSTAAMSDDEPLYDKVCSDEEDYASIDSHSLQNEDGVISTEGEGDVPPTTEQVMSNKSLSGTLWLGAFYCQCCFLLLLSPYVASFYCYAFVSLY